jgi:putative membrane-bound dehydrogenase-like protein
VASVPAVEFPCQVATAPDGSLFVAEDPMDQRGPYEAADGRILRFPNGGNGGEPTVFATGLRAIQGMAWYNGALYVSHMPFLSVLRDGDGDGAAEERQDLFRDLGPTNNRGLNDHIVSGVQFGMDGWLYISVGDKGVPGATRPEDGLRVQLQGGGVLRCRPDGTGLEVYSSGTRNHLEANLDALDRVFTYDNTDDGLGWWTRLSHHIDGGYFGYPYDYHDRPDRFLPCLAEYGGGSPCGAVFYREAAWPEAYHGLGLWAEWGKGKVQAFRFRPRGASFEVAEVIDFAIPDQVADFRPIDLALSHDGRTLFVADWNLGGWGDARKVGRIWAIEVETPADEPPRGTDSDPIPDLIAALDHPAYAERMRAQAELIRRGGEALEPVQIELERRSAGAAGSERSLPHLVWILDGIAGRSPAASMPLIRLLDNHHVLLRREAARALGQRQVPLATDALSRLLDDASAEVRLEAAIALGRIGDLQAVPALAARLNDPDSYVAFAARVALRRIANWDALADQLQHTDPTLRLALIDVLDGQYHPRVADILIRILREHDRPAGDRSRALQIAAELARRPRPWDGSWWGTRPAAAGRPPHSEDWEETPRLLQFIQAAIDDPEPSVRRAAIAGVVRNEHRDAAAQLMARFTMECDPEIRRELAQAFGRLRYAPAVPVLIEAIRDVQTDPQIRSAALDALQAIGAPAIEPLVRLLADPGLQESLQPDLINALGKSRASEAVPVLLTKLTSPSPATRGAAAAALGRAGTKETVGPALRTALDDPDPTVRIATVEALGAVRDRDAIPLPLNAFDGESTQNAAALALARMPDPSALRAYLWGLSQRSPELRNACARAIRQIRDLVVPALNTLAERHELPTSVLSELRTIYSEPRPIQSWKILGPFRDDQPQPLDPTIAIDLDAVYPGADQTTVRWTDAQTEGRHHWVDLGRRFGGQHRLAFALTRIESTEPRTVELVMGSDDTLTVWVNGQQVYDFAGERGFAPEQGRATVELRAGSNDLVVRCGNRSGGWQFAVAVATTPDYPFLRAPAGAAYDPEAYRDYALSHAGDPERGRTLFTDPMGLACLKCHRVGNEGGQVGPDLTGIGGRYTRPQLIESVLYPSAKIFSGYEPWVIATIDGQILTGLVRTDDGKTLTLIDAEAQTIDIPHDQIDERRQSDVSLMPSGLAEGLTQEEFADLIAYLASLSDIPAETSGDHGR